MDGAWPAAAGRVLVLMPTARDAERTAVLLREVNVQCQACAEMAELCRELRAGADVLLLTEEAISGDASGQLAEALRDQPAWSALPIVVLAREGWERSAEQLRSTPLDSAIIVERPVRTRTLLSVVTSALRARRNQYQIRDAMLARERQAAEIIAQQGELARQAEELRRADRRKDEFLATLAHELRNPLAPIRTGLELLARAPDEESRQRTLGVMHRQIAHMVRLIDDLLDVSRITRGKLELKREKINLASAIAAAVEASRPLMERKQHALSVTISDGAMCSDADLTRIAQVISNLLNNASNYTPAGGNIELSAERDGDFAVIRVRDDGVGIPSDRLEDVFELFSQVNRSLERSQGGLGIGLALVRSLVEMHGGSVRAESAGPDQGSTFTVRLPLVKEALPAREAASTSALSRQAKKKRVLVADDNEDAADLLTLSLQQAGYQTQTAYDGASALAGIAAFQPEVAILDIGLPDMTGYDLARAVRRTAPAHPLALIALTGWGSPDDKRKAFEAGFDFHLTKPVDAKDLEAALSELDRRARDAARHGSSPSSTMPS